MRISAMNLGPVIVLLGLLGSGCVTTKTTSTNALGKQEKPKADLPLTTIDQNWGIALPAKVKMDRQAEKGFVVASFIGGKPAKEILTLYSGKKPSPSCKISTPMQIITLELGGILWKKATCDGNAKTEYLTESQGSDGDPIYIHVFKTERGALPEKSEKRVEALLERIQRTAVQ